MGLDLRIYMLLATALQGDEGENFLLSVKLDGRNSETNGPLTSEVASSGIIVWNNCDTGGNKDEMSIEVEQDSSLTFELRRASGVQGLLPSTEKPIAHFSTKIADMYSQRKGSALELNELGSQIGSRVLHLYWDIDEIQASRYYPRVGVSDPKRHPRQPPWEVYSQLLLGLGRGTPLWGPMCPLIGLPKSYKRNGIGIGDIITPHDGSFIYHFNIFHRPGHEENPADLPDDFLWPGVVPNIYDYDEEREAFENHVRGIGRCTTNDSTLEYTMCASKWAILAVPNGSRARHVVNPRIFSNFLATKGEDLYKYFMDKRGFDLKNGDVSLVVGCTKANSWGMAAFSDLNPSPHPCTLKFAMNPENPRIPEHDWDCSNSFVSIKAGPTLYDIRGLREESEDDMDVQQRSNQCLFVNTIGVAIRGDIWNKLFPEIEGITIGAAFRDSEGKTSGQQGYALSSGFGRRYAGHSFDPRDTDPSKAIQRHLLAMRPNAKSSTSGDMDWMPLSKESAAFLPNSEPYMPYILSRVLELNEIYEENGGVSLKPRDFDIPSILLYVNSVDHGLPAKIEAKAPYSKVTFVRNLDQADMWILEINGRYHGRIIHRLAAFRDASEPLLRVAFAQILPLFRLMLQLGGTLEIHPGPHSLAELKSLDDSPELKPLSKSWYSFSKETCFVCDSAIPGEPFKKTDFGLLVPYGQTILPLGRDAVDILSRHFTTLSTSLQKPFS